MPAFLFGRVFRCVENACEMRRPARERQKKTSVFQTC